MLPYRILDDDMVCCYVGVVVLKFVVIKKEKRCFCGRKSLSRHKHGHVSHIYLFLSDTVIYIVL